MKVCSKGHLASGFQTPNTLPWRAPLSHFAGAEIKISRPVEDKNPVVIARLGRDKTKRTVTFYGHYDVQPAMEREWTTDPFEMSAIDGYYYGRGTSDNKVLLPPFAVHVM